MKILFVIHRLDYADHIAIAYLSAIAKQLNHSTYFCSLATKDLVSTIKDIRPDIVAYSVNILGFRKIIEEHKKAINVHKFISIMGGPQATFSPDTFPESGMDVYCIGEGEYAFRDFLIKVEKGESFDEVPNLITKNRINPVRPLIQNLDELPPADRDLTISNSFLKNVSKKTFYATRGCPFGCAYCCNNYYHQLYKGKGPIVRRFSVERIIKEIEDVKSKYRTDFVKFGDDLFAAKADKWLEEFAEKYPKRIGIPFNCYLRFDRVDDDILTLLKKAGCYSVHLSVDSTSKHVRDNILKRKMKDVDIAKILKKIKDYGINTFVNYMLAAPESILQDDLDTIKLSKEGHVTYTHYTTTDPMKGTELYNYCIEKKIIDPSIYKGDMTGISEMSILSCFTEKEKKIRFNIYLLGPLIANLPFPLYNIAIFMIKVMPPNKYFRKIHRFYSRYKCANDILKIRKGG